MEVHHEVKVQVAKVNQRAYEDLWLNTKEGEVNVYKLAKQRDRHGIKDRDGDVLIRASSVMGT